MTSFTKLIHGVAACACLGCSLFFYSTPATPHDVTEHTVQKASADAVGYKRSVKTYTIPDVMLTDFDNRPVRLRDLLVTNDPVMMNFVFTTCRTICPVTTKVLSEVPSRLGGDGKRLRMISISIDPENDTPLQLKAYARSFQAGERWKFLTGNSQDVKTVLMALDSYRGDKMNHEPVTLMRQASIKSWVRIDGFATPDELVREYRKVVEQ